MGGERETVVEQKATSDAGVITAGSIRIHESGGEVHFHDDAAGRKVAVPVAVWFERYEALLSGAVDSVRCIDPVNDTVLSVSFHVRRKKRLADLRIEIDDVSMSQTFRALHKFTGG